jgi:hypothetical protein
MLGPIDYIVIGFEGNNFDGSILDELSKAVNDEIIRVIDLIFIMKQPDGSLVDGEYEDQSKDVQEMLQALRYDINEGMPLISEADIAKIGEQMKNDTAAGVLVLEHLWAKGLKNAIQKADGYIIADGRIHAEAVESAVKELATASK